MTNRTSKIYALMAVAIGPLLGSCSADKEGEGSVNSDNTLPVVLTVGIDEALASTRAASDIHSWCFEVGETFPAEFAGGVTPAAVNYTVIALGNGFNDCKADVTPEVTKGVVADITAYYPSKSDPGVKPDQSTKANYLASDYMVGKGKVNGNTTPQAVTITSESGSNYNVTLQPGHGRIYFTHKRAKIEVNARAISDLKIKKIVCNGSSSITMYDNPSGEAIVKCACLMTPGSLSGDFLVITTDKGDVTYTLASAQTTVAGHSYVLDLPVTHVDGVVSITGWTNVIGAVGDPQWQ